MADIFISYSRRDSEAALSLAERLRAVGANVWMDTAVLSAAETWSAEIVHAIEKCTHFFLLLSLDSVASINVTKEVSIASEAKKTIVPIEIHHCELNAAMKYALAGLQKVSLFDEVALLRAFEKLGISGADFSPSNTSMAPERTEVRSTTLRIAVLPFEDLSPNHDNEWFSDGLTNELISTLTKLPELYVIDKQTSKMYKGAKLSSKHIAHELNVRYLVTGEVRKAGEKIRIQASLLDTTDGRTLWDEKFNGTMDDIFEIQEKTALDITNGLKLKLTPEEEKILETKMTESVEAYELYLRAEYLRTIATIETVHEIIQIMDRATALDPNFAEAYAIQAEFYMYLHRVYGMNPQHLVEAERLIGKALEAKPGNIASRRRLAWLYFRQQKFNESEEIFLDCVNADPHDYKNIEALADFYYWQEQYDRSVPYFEKAHELNPDAMRPVEALCHIYQLDDTTPAQLKHWSSIGLALSRRRLKNDPNHENVMIQHAGFLIENGQQAAAKAFIDQMPTLHDPRSLFNVAVIHMHLLDKNAAKVFFMKALENGFTWFDGFAADELNDEFFADVHAAVAKKKAELAAKAQNTHG